ncbi:MAG TPA: amidohydrolase family protein [Candidatus Udaeobacter sp.]|jgi:cytosine/adenosine deaminase-related metal-dependent hydrolase|nr:amidohydrolase family protein [Candidatus Udaeobacter sp.]
MHTILVHSGTLIPMDAGFSVTRGDVRIEDGVIAAVGTGASSGADTRDGAERIDASGCFVLPGLVHGHVHLCQTLFRGGAEQSDLLRWLRESIWPLEAAHDPSSIMASARLGLLELIAGGVTCVNDMGTVRHTDAIGEALAGSGIRAIFGKALMDQGAHVPKALIERPADAIEDALGLAKRHHGAAGGRLRVSLAPRFILSCSERLWRDVRDASRERGLTVHTHLSESPGEGREVEAAVKRSAARYFAAEDVLSPRFVGAHGVWLDAEELTLIRRAGAALVHCPGSNLKLGSGFARVAEWRRAGVRAGIGSDGAACNNRLDTFHEMSLAAGLSRTLDPNAPLGARDVLALATRDGAEALGLGDVTGSLEPGKQADLILVDARAPHLAPRAEVDPYAALVHAARPGDVRLTMVAGRVLYRDGAWSTLDPDRVPAEAEAEARGLFARARLAS